MTITDPLPAPLPIVPTLPEEEEWTGPPEDIVHDLVLLRREGRLVRHDTPVTSKDGTCTVRVWLTPAPPVVLEPAAIAAPKQPSVPEVWPMPFVNFLVLALFVAIGATALSAVYTAVHIIQGVHP